MKNNKDVNEYKTIITWPENRNKTKSSNNQHEQNVDNNSYVAVEDKLTYLFYCFLFNRILGGVLICFILS